MRALGQLLLSSRIAGGALGDVFLGRGVASRTHDLAVKVLHPEVTDDPRFVRLLLTEAPAALRFSHRSAVRVVAVDRFETEAYVAMEYVSGQPLVSLSKRTEMAGERLDPRLVLWIGAELAGVLAAMHAIAWAQGTPAPMIHGGLSPRCVLIAHSGEVKLTGLGIGRARLSLPSSSSRLPYVAPELLQRTREPGPRADTYALGVLLYDALAPRPAFRRATDDETRKAILEGSAPALDTGALGLDAGVGELLLEMMAQDPEARPQDLIGVERLLRQAAGDRPGEHKGALAERMQALFAGEVEVDRRSGAAVGLGPRGASGTQGHGAAPGRNESLRHSPGDRRDRGPVSSTEEEPTSPGFALQGLDPTSVRKPNSTLDLSRRDIGRYHTLAIVGRSEGTAMFHASDPTLGRAVTLKVFDPTAVQDEDRRPLLLKAFRREARLAGRLEHPSLPRVHDAGREGELHFMVYGWVDGERLSTLVEREKRLATPLVEKILLDLASALAHAHERGVVIADLRTTSILVDVAGNARIVDLGLGGEIDGDPHPLLSSLRALQAPEFVENASPEASADQFMLGMLAYYLLTGVRPFLGGDERDLSRRIREESPPDPRELDETIDPKLAAVVMRLLEKAPERRFESCAALAAELEREDPRERVPRPRTSSKITLTGRAETASLDSETLAWALVAAIERTVTLAAPVDPSSDIGPVEVARAMARRFRLGRRAEVLGAIALSARCLASRMRLSPSADEILSLLPREVLPVLDEVDRLVAGRSPSSADDEEPSWLAQILVVVEHYFAATRPDGGNPAVAPRAAIRGLRDAERRGISAEVVDALIERVREFDPGVDAGRADRIGKKVLVMGERFGSPLVQALAHDGFEIERIQTSHEAWARIQRDQFAGTIVEQKLPGRESLSLLKLCREHPSTRELPFIILTTGSDPAFEAEVARAGSAEVVERGAATEVIRFRVQRLMR